jgi:hypothetical protein
MSYQEKLNTHPHIHTRLRKVIKKEGGGTVANDAEWLYKPRRIPTGFPGLFKIFHRV